MTSFLTVTAAGLGILILLLMAVVPVLLALPTPDRRPGHPSDRRRARRVVDAHTS